MKWIPKIRNPSPTFTDHVISILVVTTAISFDCPATAVTVDFTLSEKVVSWDFIERSLIHIDLEMRYDPLTNSYRIFVGEEGNLGILYIM